MKLFVRSLLVTSLGACTLVAGGAARAQYGAPSQGQGPGIPGSRPPPMQPGMQQPGAGQPGGEQPGAQGDTRAPGLVGALTDALDQLQLRPEQESAARQLFDTLDQRGAEVGNADRDLLLALADQIESGSVDPRALAPKIDALATATEDAGTAMRSTLDQLHKLLEPQQRQQLADALRQSIGAGSQPGGAQPGQPGMQGEPGMQGPPSTAPGGGQLPMPGGQGPMNLGSPMGGVSQGLVGQPGMQPPAMGQAGGEPPAAGPEQGAGSGFEKWASALGLSDQQKQQIQQVIQQQGAPPTRTGQADMAQILDAFGNESFSAEQLAPVGDTAQRARELARRTVELTAAIVPILTPEQRARVADAIRKSASGSAAQQGQQPTAEEESLGTSEDALQSEDLGTSEDEIRGGGGFGRGGGGFGRGGGGFGRGGGGFGRGGGWGHGGFGRGGGWGHGGFGRGGGWGHGGWGRGGWGHGGWGHGGWGRGGWFGHRGGFGHFGGLDHFHRFGRHFGWGAWGGWSGWGGFYPGWDVVAPLWVTYAPVWEEPVVVYDVDVIPTIRVFQLW